VTVKRINRGKGHSYVLEETGERLPGVTTLTKALPKDALVEWAAKATVDYAIDNWAELSRLPLSERIKRLLRARYEVVDKASNRGTQVHKLADKLVHGDRVVVPEGLEGYVEAYVRFLDEWSVQPVLAETVVWSPRHKYSGTLDLIADMVDPEDPEPDESLRRRERWLLDIKTSRSGVFAESVLQLLGYWGAEFYIDDEHNEQPMLQVDRVGVVHVRANGYDVIPIEANDLLYRRFLYIQQIQQFMDEYRAYIGEPIPPASTSAYRLVRD
jgi:hypothetical protein